ncbi:sulfate/bicarbonate/oxalate exchanger SAT-1 [Aspergillus campestris IBT 28561]|uniref:Sulfate/bicarbonate/oxalate exchanger SAT-1 n=1 Tax=Aspergillus campestris (strain IBT 28561) TaxID=1392248 RepID=A0A2I1D5P1_ASPC2|nr:sulfate/bicarbonate/oxalate exchanger SAT-1 [Aspergillus campestris IBT 28561]PKY05189.1 sulfate/bicarbonate/oxalate exchanger SAT-1 [Aspergillus campestris IBT 28561]
MGVFRTRNSSGSGESGLPPRPSVDRLSPDPAEAPIEQAHNGSLPHTFGVDPLVSGGSCRTPSRSFYHRSFNNANDPAHYSSRGLREQTAELASLALSLNETSPLAERNTLPPSLDVFRRGQQRSQELDLAVSPKDTTIGSRGLMQPLDAEPSTLHTPGSSVLTEMIRKPSHESPDVRSSHRKRTSDLSRTSESEEESEMEDASVPDFEESQISSTERSSLLHSTPSKAVRSYGSAHDVENQGSATKRKRTPLNTARFKAKKCFRVLTNPKAWDRRTIWEQGVVHPASLLPSVFLGLLLNILDALSYGMILFPLGEPIFADLGSDGISMFYVSTIIAQLMIEVVPFFHQMAFTILHSVGEENPKSVIATSILAFAVSSIMTGLVFFLMGACGLGSLIGFFPRHILIGCIGGVGFFLMATGIEVSARLPGTLEFTMPTLQKLFQLDTLPLWVIPLFLAVGILVLKRIVRSNFLVGGYFVGVGVAFYIVKLIAGIPMEALRNSGWVFNAPSFSKPWYNFYTLYDFAAVDWSAFVETIPAMLALTFFGILHVPINVPALGISTGEDNLNVDRELIAHGVTNALSGFSGSIQNYLVYTNSLLFIDSGGNSRLAGVMLAGATMGILVIGPVIVGFIPVMVVGALIFMLGIELMQEALVDTWGKLHRLEYMTVVIIVLTMGVWDFVVGIFVGIILACMSFVLQTSRKSAIRATYSGRVAGSTVRRPPIQQRFLREAGQQTLIIKLGGYLFFGTIVDVENQLRGLIEEESFNKRPIRFLVLDFSRVVGLDFSAAEAFTRISRILSQRKVQMSISGLDVEGEVGRSLQNVGLFEPVNGVELFEDLNSALEFSENDYLKIFYRYRESLFRKRSGPSSTLAVPTTSHPQSLSLAEGTAAAAAGGGGIVSSPRHRYLQQAATTTLHEDESATFAPAAWSAMRQPLPLLLQTFQGLTPRNEDFWFPVCAFFTRETYAAGSILFEEGDVPRSFYLLESGMLRAEYEMPQGRYFELIVAGGPCGELPFFSETRRTATVRAEQDCVAWCLSVEKWGQLREREPELARELLIVSLKLTRERMDSITSHVLTMAA